MPDHAAASPSSAEMWLNCPASVTLAEGRTRPSSLYAKEGTAAHQIAEMILRGELFPPGRITVEGSEFIVGLPMLRALNPYISLVEQLRDRKGSETHVEAKVAVNGSRGIVWGTADTISRKGRWLDVVDLKYGMGVLVSPDSAQLKIYAIAAWDTFWPKKGIDYIRLNIVQPRLNPQPQDYVMDRVEIQDWRDEVLIPGIARIEAGDTTETYGHWCRWCVRRGECNTFKLRKNTQAAEIFDDGLDNMQHTV
jgi:Protein of unknown function (DUF2800)